MVLKALIALLELIRTFFA
ncbi:MULTISPECIES: damage-inducible type I toxin DinQ [Photorhabdus]